MPEMVKTAESRGLKLTARPLPVIPLKCTGLPITRPEFLGT
jgi:hypothetical protein